jgi:hypothetical protein
MTVAEKLQRDGFTNDEILDFFKNAARKVYALVRDADPGNQFAKYRRAQVAAILRIIAELDAQQKAWVKEHIPGIMEAANEEVTEQMRGEAGFSFRFAGVNQEAVKVLTSVTALNFGNAVTGLKASGEKALLNKRAIQSEIVQGVIQGASVSRTQRELLADLRQNGFRAVRYRNGREVALEDYTNMLIRTQSVMAYNTAARNTMLAAGRLFGIFPTIRPDIDGEDVCNEWERKKFVNLKTDPLPPLSTHPRCRHVVRAATFEELRERPDLYQQAVGFYHATVG